MDSFQMNKIIGAVLGTVFVVFSIAIVSNSLFSAHAPEQFGFVIEAEEPEAGGAAPEGQAGPEPVGPLLASADPAAGEAVFKRCVACHTVDEGGANRVGPNLWDVVGRPVAAVEGFNYSSGMREEAASGDSVWDYEHLSEFLLSPRTAVPGTSMGFAGLPKITDRANLIAFLREHSNDPAPLPSADATSDDAAADGDAAATDDAAAGDEPVAETPAEEPAEVQPAAPEGEAIPADDTAVETDDVSPAGAATVQEVAPAAYDSGVAPAVDENDNADTPAEDVQDAPAEAPEDAAPADSEEEILPE